jgi:hypothetical protein
MASAVSDVNFLIFLIDKIMNAYFSTDNPLIFYLTKLKNLLDFCFYYVILFYVISIIV